MISFSRLMPSGLELEVTVWLLTQDLRSRLAVDLSGQATKLKESK